MTVAYANIILLGTIAAALAVFGTGVVRRLALKHGVIDLPNERSSHVLPTPRGGGVAIVLVTAGAWIALAAMGSLPTDMFFALTGGGLAVAGVGLLDDRYQLPVRTRLMVHFAAAGWAMFWLGGLPPVQFGDVSVHSGWLGYVLGAVAIVWTVNLFNFMDGIDGIAASEAVFVSVAGAMLMALVHGFGPITAAALLFAASCCGFLYWNWPPARIFMGDAGSGFLGYAIAVLALAGSREDPVGLYVWLILGGIFFADATATLLRRLLDGQRVSEPHRSHAYQILSRRWQGHRPVTITVVFVDLLMLLPLAWLAERFPFRAVAITALVMIILGTGVLMIGGGLRSR